MEGARLDYVLRKGWPLLPPLKRPFHFGSWCTFVILVEERSAATLLPMSTAEPTAVPKDFQPRRRWKRYNFDFLVIMRFRTSQGPRTVEARGRQLNEGGMAVFAGAELSVGDNLEVEFTPPYADLPIKLKAIVRDRNEYYYGLEFAASNALEEQEVALLRLFVQGLTGRLADIPALHP